MGKSIPNAIRAAGYLVQKHDDTFPDTRTKDVVWMAEVAAHGWIALSHNKGIRHVPEERDKAMTAGLALFLLIGKNHDEYQRNLIVTLPRVVLFREKHKPPFIAKVHRPHQKFPVGSRPGTVEMWVTYDQWKAARKPRGS